MTCHLLGRDGQETLASYFRFRLGLNHIQIDENSDVPVHEQKARKFSHFVNNRRMYPGAVALRSCPIDASCVVVRSFERGILLVLTAVLVTGTSWADHIRSWKHAEESGKVKVLWLSYEALAADAMGQMRRVAEFLGGSSYISHVPALPVLLFLNALYRAYLAVVYTGLAATNSDLEFAILASSKEVMKKMQEEGGGLDFFKQRYQNVDHKKFAFVDSTTSHELKTSSLWTGVNHQAQEVWRTHNGGVMSCLGYDARQ